MWQRNGEVPMSIRENVQIAKEFFTAMSRGDRQGLLALSAEDTEWIIPGEDWPLAGTHRGRGIRNGKLTNIREYIDTQALARASEIVASPR